MYALFLIIFFLYQFSAKSVGTPSLFVAKGKQCAYQFESSKIIHVVL